MPQPQRAASKTRVGGATNQTERNALEVGCYPTKQASPKPYISYRALIPTPRTLEVGFRPRLSEAPPCTQMTACTWNLKGSFYVVAVGRAESETHGKSIHMQFSERKLSISVSIIALQGEF